MSIAKEFITFFNNVIVGSEKSSGTEDQIPAIIESNTVMDSLSAKVSNTISDGTYQTSLDMMYESPSPPKKPDDYTIEYKTTEDIKEINYLANGFGVSLANH